MPRTLVSNDGLLRIYEVTDGKGAVIGSDAEMVAPPETVDGDLRPEVEKLRAQMSALKAVPEITSKVDLDAVKVAVEVEAAARGGR